MSRRMKNDMVVVGEVGRQGGGTVAVIAVVVGVGFFSFWF